MALNDNYIPLKYNGNATQKEFPVIWNVNEASTVVVATYTPKDELIKTYIQGTDYTYTANTAPGIGGRVTTTVAPANGEILVVTRDEPYLQWLELLNSGKLDLAALEKALDHMMMCIQQNRDEAARSIKVPPSSAEPPELLATLIFEARDQALASATNAKKSESNALASEIEAEAAAAEAKATLEAAQEVIAGDLSGAQAAIAADKADALKAIATDKAGAQSAIATDRSGAQAAIAVDKAAALSAMSSARAEALTTIKRAGDTQENRVNAAGAALVATGNDAVARVNTAGTAQIKKIEATGTKTRGDVVLEGDRQVDRVTLVGAEYVKQTHEEAEKAKGEADRAKAEADRATSIAGVDIASATNIGLCPKVGEGLKVTILPDGSPRLDAVAQVIVVSTPDMSFAAEVAIGYAYTLTMTSGTLIPGAKIAGYEVVVDGVTLPTVVADSEGVGTVQITATGVDLTTGNIAAIAVDTEGNRSKIGYKTFLKHAVVVRAPHILSPLTGDTDVALLTAFQIQSFNIYGMPATPAATQLQVARDAMFTDVVYDSGEELAYTTALTLVERLPDGVLLYVRARHRAEIYGWSAWGATESFTTVAITVKKPRIIAPIAGAVNQPIDVAVVLSELETTGIPAVPANTRVIVARDEALTDRVFDTLESHAYATSVATVNLPINSLLYFTGQHKDAELGWSPLADVSTFTTLNAFVETPSITAPTAVEGVVLKPEFVFSAFSNIGPADSHASTNFQLSRDAGFSDLVVDATITAGDKLRYLLAEELALFTIYYARVRFVGTTWGLSAWSAVYVFQTLNAFIAAPVLTGISEGQTDVDPRVRINVGAFAVTPASFDAPKKVDNVRYTIQWVHNGSSVNYSKDITLSSNGGTLHLAMQPPTNANVTLSVKWLGERLVGQETTLNFKTVDATVDAPEILSPAEGQTGVLLTPEITLSAFSNVGPEDTPKSTWIRVYSDDALTALVAEYKGPYTVKWTLSPALALDSDFWAVAQHEGNLWGLSADSVVRKFRSTNAYIEAPVITTPVEGGQLRTANAVVVCNPSVAVGCSHATTDWKLTSDAAGNDVLAQALGSSDKLAHQWALDWSPLTPVGNKAHLWRASASGNAAQVVVGDSGLFIRSVDGGITWSAPAQVISGESFAWNDVQFINEEFIAVTSASSMYAVSTDGAVWTKHTGGHTYSQSLCYSGQLYLSGNAWRTVAISPDARSWEKISIFDESGSVHFCFGGGKFVAVDDNGYASTSADGRTWTPRTKIPNMEASYSISYGNGKYVCCGASAKIATSIDGVTWTSAVALSEGALMEVIFIDTQFIVAGYGGFIATSTDGSAWSGTRLHCSSGGSASALQTVTAQNNKSYIVAGYNAIISRRDAFIDSDTQVYCHAKFNSDVEGVSSPWSAPVKAVVKESVFVAVGDAGTTSTSKDGVTWTPAVTVSGYGNILFGVTTANGKFVAAGGGGKTTTSTDGITWTSVVTVSGQTGSWYDVTYANGKFVAVGDGGKTTTSTDGVTWTNAIAVSGQTGVWWGVTYGNGKFVAVGANGKTATSIDGITWTYAVAVSGQTSIWYGVTYANGKFVVVGSLGKTTTSVDGVTWTPAVVAVSAFTGVWYGVTYSNGKFVVVGEGGRTSTSIDGVTWTTAVTISGQSGVWYGVTYSNGKFVVVGEGGRTSTSTDGLAWTTAVQINGQSGFWWSVTYA